MNELFELELQQLHEVTHLPPPARVPGAQVRRDDGWLGLETTVSSAMTVRPARARKEGM